MSVSIQISKSKSSKLSNLDRMKYFKKYPINERDNDAYKELLLSVQENTSIKIN